MILTESPCVMLLLRLCTCLFLLLPAPLLADDWEALAAPGVIGLMRHALAPGTGDPAHFRLEDCRTQRNLDARGRDQARRLGAALQARGIGFDVIWSSAWCRARETAELTGMGAVVVKPALNSFFGGRGDAAAQTAATLAALSSLPAGTWALLVTHQVNITALSGIVPASGEIIVMQRRADGGLELSGRVKTAP